MRLAEDLLATCPSPSRPWCWSSSGRLR